MALQRRALHHLCTGLLRLNIAGQVRPALSASRNARAALSSCASQTSESSPVTSAAPISIEKAEESPNVQLSKTCQYDHSKTSLCDFVHPTSSAQKHSSIRTPALGLASWPSAGHLQYICPSEKLTTTPELVILEETRNAVFYDLPETPNIASLVIIDPGKTSEKTEIADPTTANAPMEARMILKIRRKKMKRHLLKKFRKRMRFALRKMRRDRQKKKDVVFQARLAGIKDWGESFNARDWALEELDKARKGGFYINVLRGANK